MGIEKQRRYLAQWYKQRKQSGLCASCAEGKAVAGKARCSRCLKANRAKGKASYAADRAAALRVYGNTACACCNETEVAFLCIDHINNDGATHRRKLNLYGGTRTYQWLRLNGYPPGFQVLCFNCNFAKYSLGACPHAAR